MAVHVQVANQQGTVRYDNDDTHTYSFTVTELGSLRIIRSEANTGSGESKWTYKVLIEWSAAGWYSVQGQRFGGPRPITSMVDLEPEEPSDPALTIA